MHFDERKIELHTNFLDADFLKKFIENTKQANIQPATVGKIINGIYTAVYDEWCTAEFIDYSSFQDSVHLITDKMKKYVEESYKTTCISREINFLRYKDGSSYRSHIDGQALEQDKIKRAVDRDITCVFYLNDDFSGGEVFFNFFNKKYKPKANDLLIYPTTWEYMHGVNTVSGNRYALVVWFNTLPQINVDNTIRNKVVLNQLINNLKLT